MFDDLQKEFVRRKVIELGSIDEVRKLYNKDCSVDNYANYIAKMLFDPDNFELNREDKLWLSSLKFSVKELMDIEFVKKLVRVRFGFPYSFELKLPRAFAKAFSKRAAQIKRKGL